jgi:hypothetical protein
MAAKATRIYPVRNRFLHDVPAAVQVIDTKERADELVASGAFTDNPRDPERDMDAPDHTKPEDPAPAGSSAVEE